MKGHLKKRNSSTKAGTHPAVCWPHNAGVTVEARAEDWGGNGGVGGVEGVKS